MGLRGGKTTLAAQIRPIWQALPHPVHAELALRAEWPHICAGCIPPPVLPNRKPYMSNDYSPARLVDFAAWLANFSALLTATPAAFGLTAPIAVIVANTASDFAAAYALSSAPSTRTSPTIAATTAQRQITTGIVRPYAVLISQNSAVTDENKAAIGVTIRSTVITPIPAPTTQPALSLLSAVYLKHTLRYYDVSTPTSKAKPFGAKALQLWSSVGTVAATDPAQCSYVGDYTKSPLGVQFQAGDVGKKCTYFSRWVTVAGPGGQAQVGPWSDPLTVTVV